MGGSTRLHLSVALLSSALIAFQLFLMQILSVVQWYHFASLVISVALLGFGASGTLLALFRERLLRRWESTVPACMLLCASSMGAVVGMSQLGLFRFDSFLVFLESGHLLKLSGTCLLLLIPFLAGALALGILFAVKSDRPGSIYSANLVGSGAGSLLAILVMWYVVPSQLPAVAALLSFLGALSVLPWKKGKLVTAASIPVVALILVSWNAPPQLLPSEYKSLSRALNLPASRVFLDRPSPYGYLQVVSASALRYAPGLSLSYGREIPVNGAVFNNGDWYGTLFARGPADLSSRTDSLHPLDYSTVALPYAMRHRKSVLVLGAGTGFMVQQALFRRAESIRGVEVHEALLSLLRNDLAAETDSIAVRRGVRIEAGESRTSIAADTSRYDLIMLPLLGAFGGTSGLHALREQYALTTEAFQDMWRHLTETGVVCVSAWMDYPVRNPLKLAATLAEVVEGLGIQNPREHIAAVRSWGTITFVLKQTPFTDEEVGRIREFCEAMGFDPALLPGLTAEERSRHNQLQDDSFLVQLDELLSPSRESLVQKYPFSIRPATDDQPFFSQYLRWKSLPWLKEVLGLHGLPFLEVGYFIVVVTLGIVVALAIVLTLLPLMGGSTPVHGRVWGVFYFGALGIGYLFVEMALIQRFHLFLGNPVIAAGFVIGTLLVSSGAGSFLSTKLAATSPVLWRMVSIVTLTLVVSALIVPPILRSSIGLPFAAKSMVALLLITVPGVLMGIPFPLGLRLSAMRDTRLIPWAWGVNGCASVIGAALSTVVAVETGLTALTLLAAVAYGVAALAVGATGRYLTRASGALS